MKFNGFDNGASAAATLFPHSRTLGNFTIEARILPREAESLIASDNASLPSFKCFAV